MTEEERKIFQAAENKLKEKNKKSFRQNLAQKSKQRKSYIGRGEWLTNKGAFYADFYNYIRAQIPLVSNSIATWVDLCTSGNYIQFEGGSKNEQKEARDILTDLDTKVYEYAFEKESGLRRLEEIFYLAFFSYGKFCGELIPLASGKGIDTIAIIDPFTISFKREGKQINIYQTKPDGEKISLPEKRIFFSAFEPSPTEPLGSSMLDSINWVLEIKNRMMEDMARSSHNAGYPRLHIAIDPGEPLPGEATNDYVGRIDSDFDELTDAFDDVEVDDNIFTRSNVDVQLLGVSTDFNWSTNFERVTEDIVTGVRLYPWVLGLTHGTTKNWVSSQHDLLMQRVSRNARHGARFMDWVRNTELALQGLPVRTTQEFEPTRDPGLFNHERAQVMKQKRIFALEEKGWITDEQAKRILNIRE